MATGVDHLLTKKTQGNLGHGVRQHQRGAPPHAGIWTADTPASEVAVSPIPMDAATSQGAIDMQSQREGRRGEKSKKESEMVGNAEGADKTQK